MITYCIFLLLITRIGSAQEDEKYPFSKWDKGLLEKAKTYNDDSKISELEKNIIFYTNLARLNPKLFAQTYVKKYVDEHELKSANVHSLIKDLNKAPKLVALEFNMDLYYCAKAHAESNGKKGLEGHQNYNARFKKYAPQFVINGENCDYGSNEALDVVMSLLIDEDVPGYGHRKNILNTEFKYLGTAYAPHKIMEHNVVMCFGG